MFVGGLKMVPLLASLRTLAVEGESHRALLRPIVGVFIRGTPGLELCWIGIV